MLASPKVPRRDWERGAEGGSLLSRSAIYNMDMDTPTDLPLFTKLYTLAQVLGILSVVLVGVWVGLYRGGFGWSAFPDLQFNWHPFLMVLGLVLLYANGALIYRGFRSERKRKLKVVHAVVMVSALVCAVVGLVAVFKFHDSKGFANMHSLHSWIGLATVILFACQWLAGFLTFLFPGLRSSLRAAYLPLHQYFGLFIFAGAITSTLLGLSEKAIFVQSVGSESVLVNVTGLCVAVFAGLVTYLLSQPKFRRQATEDEVLLTDTVLE
ncbi:hypothetical protein O3P69_019459 [Scylla paramamosain]|uniref:Cytochrome b561 domain-containing protein n=1 Tax=Scylla paramamosain TaxID=85552 RepID=A0AAW0SXM7_SCYPA